MSTHGKERKGDGGATCENYWTQRDCLTLASVVQRLGERNWMSVSRYMKTVGDQTMNWYTPKKCSDQYTILTKLVEDKKPSINMKGKVQGSESASVKVKKKPMTRAERENMEDLLVKHLHDQRMQQLVSLTQECETLKCAFDEMENLVDCGYFDEGNNLDLLTSEVERFCDIWEDTDSPEIYECHSARERSPSPIKTINKSPPCTKGKSSAPGIEQHASTSATQSSEHDAAVLFGDSEQICDDSFNALPSVSMSEVKKNVCGMPSSSVSSTSFNPVVSIVPSQHSVQTLFPCTVAETSLAHCDSALEAKSLDSLGQQDSPQTVSSPQSFFSSTNLQTSAAAGHRELDVASSSVPQSQISKHSELPNVTNSVVSIASSASPAKSITLSAPTLSKLLEMPISIPGKLPPLPTVYNSQYLPASQVIPGQLMVEDKEDNTKLEDGNHENTSWQFRLRGSEEVQSDKDNLEEKGVPDLGKSTCLLGIEGEIPENASGESTDSVKPDNSNEHVEDNVDSAPDTEVLSSESSPVNFSSDNNEQSGIENICADIKSDSRHKRKWTNEKSVDSELTEDSSSTALVCMDISVQELESKHKKMEKESLKAGVGDVTEDSVTQGCEIEESENVRERNTEVNSSHSFESSKNIGDASSLTSPYDFLTNEPQKNLQSDSIFQSVQDDAHLVKEEKTAAAKGSDVESRDFLEDMDDSDDTPLVFMIKKHSKSGTDVVSQNTAISHVSDNASDGDTSHFMCADSTCASDNPVASTPRKLEGSDDMSSSSKEIRNFSAAIQEYFGSEKSSAPVVIDCFSSPEKASTSFEESSSPEKEVICITSSSASDDCSSSPKKVQKPSLSSDISNPRKPQKSFSISDESFLSCRKLNAYVCITQESIINPRKLKHSTSVPREFSSGSSNINPLKKCVSSNNSNNKASSKSNKSSRGNARRAKSARFSTNQSLSRSRKTSNSFPSEEPPSDESLHSEGSSTIGSTHDADSTVGPDDSPASVIIINSERDDHVCEVDHKNETGEFADDSDKSCSGSSGEKYQVKKNSKVKCSPARSSAEKAPKKKVLSRRGRRGGRTVPKSSSYRSGNLRGTSDGDTDNKDSRSGDGDTSVLDASTGKEKKINNDDKMADSDSSSNKVKDCDKVYVQARALPRCSRRRGRRGRRRTPSRMPLDDDDKLEKETQIEMECAEETEKLDVKKCSRGKSLEKILKESSEKCGYMRLKGESDKEGDFDKDPLPKHCKDDIESDTEDMYDKGNIESPHKQSDLAYMQSEERQVVDDSSSSSPASTVNADDMFKVRDEKDILLYGPASQCTVTPTTSDSSDESSEDSDESIQRETGNSNDSSLDKTVPKVKRCRKDREAQHQYKRWKKSICMIWREASYHKYANVFSQKVTDDVAPGYQSIVNRPMDLSLIKKNIDNGTITTTEEFQRDMMLMFQNAIMYNSSDHDVYQMAVEMQRDVNKLIQDYLATQLIIEDKIKEPAVAPSLRAGRHMKTQTKTQQRVQVSKGGKE